MQRFRFSQSCPTLRSSCSASCLLPNIGGTCKVTTMFEMLDALLKFAVRYCKDRSVKAALSPNDREISPNYKDKSRSLVS
jgi:hypothetical protein